MNNKILIGIVAAVVLIGGFFVLRQKNLPGNGGTESKNGATSSTESKGGSTKLVTAKEAWEKVKPEADKWSSSYKIAKISDVSSPQYQRIDGKSVGWEFYLEECQEYFTGSMADTCKTGKTKTFYYQVTDFVGRSKGATADSEQSITSGRTAFSPDIFKVDSDEAQDLARQVVDRERNENEEFVMATGHSNGIFYWEVRRQCFIGGDRSKCDSQNGYSAYVNLETGEAYSSKP
jgi:hypothetical protein